MQTCTFNIRTFVEENVICPLKSFSHAVGQLPERLFYTLFPSEPDLMQEQPDTSQKFTFDNHFSRAYVINLDSATKKLDAITIHLKEVGTNNWERFSAVNGYKLAEDTLIDGTNVTFKDFYSRMPGTSERHKRARAGCYLSHLYALKKARTENLETIHIHEDDALHAQNKRAVEVFEKTMQELPENWDLLFLGFHHDIKPKPISQHVDRVESGNCMHSYVVHKRCFDRLIGHLEQAITDTNDELLPIDEVISEHLERKNYQAFSPHKLISFQRDGLTSDITGNTNSDYSLFRKYVQQTYAQVVGPALNTIGLRKYMLYKAAAKIGRCFGLSY